MSFGDQEYVEAQREKNRRITLLAARILHNGTEVIMPGPTDENGEPKQPENLCFTIESRQKAHAIIREKIERLRNEANYLEALLKAIPPELPREADHALWSLIIRSGP